MGNNNNYFETVNRVDGEFSEETVIGRINECNLVLGDIGKSEAWKILLADAQRWIKQLDDNWQELDQTQPEWRKAVIVKMTFKHIVDIPKKYYRELKYLEEQLEKMKKPEEFIIKDMDNS